MIEIKDLHKAFGDNQVLSGINLKVDTGQSLVVIGGSGTGKSVLLKCILDLLPADSGQIMLDGHDLHKGDRDIFLRRFGMLFQGGALFDSLSVWENVAFRLLRGRNPLSKAQAREIANQKLRRVGLSADVGDQYPAELSGGMQKRVSIARAIAAKPDIIFFDEPTAGLDPIMSGVINDLIREIVDELGVTAITITHDMNSVRVIADHVAMLYQGRVQWHGTVTQLEKSGNPYLDQFLHGRAQGPIDTLC